MIIARPIRTALGVRVDITLTELIARLAQEQALRPAIALLKLFLAVTDTISAEQLVLSVPPSTVPG